MIITTRYRDIPLSEIAHEIFLGENQIDDAKWERDGRGRPIKIQTPQYEKNAVVAVPCDGPFYRVVGTFTVVCPHIAEIGD